MEAQKVIIHQSVIDKLNALVEILFEKNYFYIEDNAKEYVYLIYTFINEIPKKHHRLSRNTKNGKYFCSYKPNKNTTWYVTFDVEEDIYLINNFTNNHSADYPRFINGIK